MMTEISSLGMVPRSSNSDNDTTEIKYIALRVGKHVKKCVFFCWEDAKVHIEDYDQAEYKVFEQIKDVRQYVFGKDNISASYTTICNGIGEETCLDSEGTKEKEHMNRGDDSSGTAFLECQDAAAADDDDSADETPMIDVQDSRDKITEVSAVSKSSENESKEDVAMALVYLQSESKTSEMPNDTPNDHAPEESSKKKTKVIDLESAEKNDASQFKKKEESPFGDTSLTTGAASKDDSSLIATATSNDTNTPFIHESESIERNVNSSVTKSTSEANSTQSEEKKNEEPIEKDSFSKVSSLKVSERNKLGKKARFSKKHPIEVDDENFTPVYFDPPPKKKRKVSSTPKKASAASTPKTPPATQEKTTNKPKNPPTTQKQTPKPQSLTEVLKVNEASLEEASKQRWEFEQQFMRDRMNMDAFKAQHPMMNPYSMAPSFAANYMNPPNFYTMAQMQHNPPFDPMMVQMHTIPATTTLPEEKNTKKTTADMSDMPGKNHKTIDTSNAPGSLHNTPVQTMSKPDKIPIDAMPKSADDHQGTSSAPIAVDPDDNTTVTKTTSSYKTTGRYAALSRRKVTSSKQNATATTSKASTTSGISSKPKQNATATTSATGSHNFAISYRENNNQGASSVPIFANPNQNALPITPGPYTAISRSSNFLVSHQFDLMIHNLRAYKEKHGHFIIDKDDDENQALFLWLKRQELDYVRTETNKSADMTKAKLEAFKSIGYQFKYYFTWDARMDQLKTFKNLTGGVDVPLSNKILGKWVDTQRAQLKLFRKKKTKSCKITEEQANQLLELGLKEHPPKLNEVWLKNFKLLTDFKMLHGHTDIPKSDEENKTLHHWVTRQRYECKKHKEGQFDPITELKLNKLKEIGFDFGYYTWDERIKQLEMYKQVTGGLDVPMDHALLGTWVYQQRLKLELYVTKNDTSKLSEENAKQLLEMGLTGRKKVAGRKKVSNRTENAELRKEREEKWQKGYEQLKEYQKIVGKDHVIQRNENESVYLWTAEQRKQNRLLDQGKPCHIDLAKISKLHEIGFQFRMRKKVRVGATFRTV